MAKPVGDGANVDAGTQQFGGDEVPQIVKTHVIHADLSTQSFPSSGHQLGPPRSTSLGVAREDQVAPLHLAIDGAGDVVGPENLTLERVYGAIGE